MKNAHILLVEDNEGDILLTTSSSENDVRLSYKYHANCYITKPVDVDDFMGAVSTIEEFWFSLVVLPNK